MSEDPAGWDAGTWEGSRRRQREEVLRLSVRERMELLDELNRTGEHLRTMPRRAAEVEPDGGPEALLREWEGPRRSILRLPGCQPTPLASYLKALGILRIVGEQFDPGVRGWWGDAGFFLWSEMDRSELADTLLHEYQPSPIFAPWNGGSGFYQKDKTDAIEALEASGAERFLLLRQSIHEIRRHLDDLDLVERPDGETKERLLERLRASLSDPLLVWIDAAVVLTGDGPKYPPLLGTGGNDGRLEFTNNFMQRVVGLFDVESGEPSEAAASLLDAALFDQPAPALEKTAIGQFAPGAAGGPNASTGYSGDAQVNPWDYVLMLEGALLFATRAARRLEGETPGHLSFPFTVRATGAGSGNTDLADEGDARAETWMPVWRRPATMEEVRTVLGEGRVSVGRQTAGDGLDFSRAVAKLGVDRGITEFQRFGYMMRSGRAYLATPLDRIRVRRRPEADLIDQLDTHEWLRRFRRTARSGDPPARLRRLARRLEDELFALSKGPGDTARTTQRLLVTLGALQLYLGSSGQAREGCPPVPVLGQRWVETAHDRSPEFELATALAGLHSRDADSAKRLPLLGNMSPVEVDRRGRRRWDEGAGHRVVWGAGSLHRNLSRVLERRLLDQARMDLHELPLAGWSRASLGAVCAWLSGAVDESRIRDLLPGLALCRIPGGLSRKGNMGWPPPAAFGVLKPLFTPHTDLERARAVAPEGSLPLPSELPRLLAAKKTEAAMKLALRTLRAHGLVPLQRSVDVRSELGPVLLSALLVPLSTTDLKALLGRTFDLEPHQ